LGYFEVASGYWLVSETRKGGSMNIIWWLIIGLMAGAVARLLVPGRDPMGLLGTLALGLVGSLIGGFLGYLLDGGETTFSPAGLIGSIVGAVIALLIYRASAGRRRSFRRGW
jgi:uncharacterized membrane protein YeaQ/YmgE (transglycosylase-associated protein family)